MGNENIKKLFDIQRGDFFDRLENLSDENYRIVSNAINWRLVGAEEIHRIRFRVLGENSLSQLASSFGENNNYFETLSDENYRAICSRIRWKYISFDPDYRIRYDLLTEDQLRKLAKNFNVYRHLYSIHPENLLYLVDFFSLHVFRSIRQSTLDSNSALKIRVEARLRPNQNIPEEAPRPDVEAPQPEDYQLLELREGATLQDVTREFRRLSRIHHPDRNRNNVEEATARFQLISAAYNKVKTFLEQS